MYKNIPLFKSKLTLSDAYQVFKTVKSQFIGPGKLCNKLENKLSILEYNSSPVILTNSGTTALFLTLLSIHKKDKNTILFPSYGFIAGANAAMLAGYNIKLVDIKKNTLCMDDKLLEKELKNNPNVNAVIFVAHNGYAGLDILNIRYLCDKYNVTLIEDAACAIGVKSLHTENYSIGNFGHYGILSFSVPKLITGGQGGAVICNDNNDIPIKKLVDHGDDNWRKTGIHTGIGGNFRMNDMQAALILNQLKRKNKLIENRIRQLYYLKNIFNLNIFDPTPSISNINGMWYFINQESTEKQAELKMNYLIKNGIAANKYYRPLSHHPTINAKIEEYPVAEYIWNTIFYLPSGPGITKSDIRYIKKVMEKY